MRSPEMGTARLESGAPAAVGAATAAAFAFLLLWASAAWPQSAPAPAPAKEWERLASTVGINELAISPDGARVAFVARREGARGQLFVLEWRRGGTPVRVVPGGARTHSEGAPAWSPDSGRLAFVSDAGQSGQNQVWVAGADGSHPKRLTGVTGYVARPHWSPDAASIAFLHIEGGRGGGPLGASGPRTGVIEETIRNQRVGVAEVKSGKVRLVSPPGLHVFDYDWSPDGRSLAVTAAPGPGDNNWWVAQLYVVDVAAGNARPLYRPRWQIAIPRWSPDGSRVAFIEGLMSDEGVHGGNLCTVPAGGGPATNHTSGRATSPSWERWVSPSRILFAEFEGGGSALSTLDLASGAIASAWRGPEEVTAGGSTTSFAAADDGSTSALVRQGFSLPPEVWAGTIGAWTQVTRFNAEQRAAWGAAESVHWKSDGLDVQGWLVPPRDVKPGVRYPLVVVVHGGPSSIATSTWPGNWIVAGALMTQGAFVLMPNPRGSYGQGEAFTQANVKDFGGGDLRDILAGVDAVLTRFPVDPGRLGITGWSYGGYMTMWAVTQTERFRAAVAGAGIANWRSYYGENLIDQWMIPFFGASVYEDPAVYERSSPIAFITRAKTPTLVIVGESDAECPAPQSFEFWHALKTLGVPTQLIVYPGEGHEFADPAHRRDRVERTLAWFEKYLHE